MNTITVRFWGGLGNVLFQIAATVAYANMFNRQIVFDSYESLPGLGDYSASSVGLNNQEYTNSLKEYSEEDIAKNIPFPNTDPHVKLIGFYQDYLFFDSLKDKIFNIIGLSKIQTDILPIVQGPSFIENRLFQSQTPTISLHIRRGDYENISCYFLLIDQYYYKLALLNIINRISTNINVLVFYEKKAYNSANKIIDSLKNDVDLLGYSIQFYHFNELLDAQKTPVTDIEEMVIMSQCDHHIIANSTYSWWAAYINYNPNKVVCYPNQFYNHQLYYLSIKGMQVNGWTSVPSWNPNKYKCACNC